VSTTGRFGGEGVRTYPAAVRDGQVWLGLADPSPAEPIAAAARFLASPKRKRFAVRSTMDAITTLRPAQARVGSGPAPRC
jgi:hypothetical protein